MIGKFVKGRVYVFIDAANILYSQKTLNWRVDYKKLKEYFLKECDLGKIFFYTGRVGAYNKQNEFLEKLKLYGYIVKAKEVKRIEVAPNTYEWKGNLDVELTIDALKNSNSFDTCILMSGDSDFASLIDELKDKGKWVVVMSTRGHISRELLQRSKYLDLRKLKDKIRFVEKVDSQKKSGASLTGSPEV